MPDPAVQSIYFSILTLIILLQVIYNFIVGYEINIVKTLYLMKSS